MKLRNKLEYIGEDKPKGRVGTLNCYDKQLDAIRVKYEGEDGGIIESLYYSLAELNEEWEDYKPKEPLIKDEKIRKAVRAWADVLDIEYIHVFHDEDINCIFRSEFSDLEIQFDGSFEEQIKDGTYTITELCGEEEE